jgi:hypothetical protein
METIAFFERKIGLEPSDLNQISEDNTIDTILKNKLVTLIENKCSEHGFVMEDTIELISRSMGYYEHARFTGDAVYFVKAKGKVLYPVDGYKVTGKVIRKNKLGLYVKYKNAINIQIPRDLHIGNKEFDDVEVDDEVEVELKKSRFQINDPFILTNGKFIRIVSSTGAEVPSPGTAAEQLKVQKNVLVNVEEDEEEEEEAGAEDSEEDEEEGAGTEEEEDEEGGEEDDSEEEDA